MELSLRSQYLKESGWLESAEAKRALRDGKPIPWFTYAAIRFLEKEVTPDLSIFEYGGGQSTLYWAERVGKLVTVDHEPEYEQLLRKRLPPNSRLHLVQEGESVSPNLQQWVDRLPALVDPVRDVRSYRSGQLNQAFQAYALKLLEHPADTFDIVIVDGMARVLSTWAAIRHFRSGGFIVFDNADRDFYQPAFEMLEQAGYRRIDFWGLGPINPYEWCTSVFYRPVRFPGANWFRSLKQERAAAVPDPDQGLGILVIGFNRPYHLQSVLESLRLQGAIDKVHLWIDGTQGRGEYRGENSRTIEIAERYAVKELRGLNSHLGIEKLMLEALDVMSRLYPRVLVLEDDCFPVEGAIALFERELATIRENPRVFSVYGHHFGTEPEDEQDFPRFQGWGWAAHSSQIRAYLPRLTQLFLMNENDYREHVAARLTPQVRERLNKTPGRDAVKVLGRYFSWDSATALLTAEDKLSHRRTQVPTILNTGITRGIGHFRKDTERLREPPFNMLSLEEAWTHYDTTTSACDFSRPSYGLDALDKLILEVIPEKSGFLVELGAFDGVTQSNSVLLEKAGWKGMLIEANPASYAKCVRNRPHMIVEHAACVAEDQDAHYTTITEVGLMSMTLASHLVRDQREQWISRGEGFAKRARQDIEVPTATLSALLDKNDIASLDLLLLDVEGAEVEVLKGLDFGRHAPRYIVAEDLYDEGVADFLNQFGYRRTHILLERKYTRDCFYQKETTQGA